MHRLPIALFASLAILMIGAAGAAANNRFTLDAGAASPGNVITDAAGTAYVAWTHAGGTTFDTPRFCKIPRGGTCPAPLALPIPGATTISDGVAGAFPVFGAGSTMYVVAPRHVLNNVVLYTSNDGGASFDGGAIIAGPGSYSSKTNPTDVFRTAGGNFHVGAYNPGLGFSTFPAGQGAISFTDPGPGGVASSAMGLDASGRPVMAYWNLSTPPYPLRFYRFGGTNPITTEANWTGPTTITNGYEPHLAGGTSGLFLVSQDYGALSTPTVLNVRKYDGTTFGAPLTLATDPATFDLFAGGEITQSPSGRIAVAWPGQRAGDNLFVMRLFVSTDGGASFGAPTNVAALGSGYAIEDNAQLATADDGGGWLTYRDGQGLQVADLNPVPTAIAPPPPPPVAPPPPVVPPPVVRPPAPTKAKTATVPGATITFTVPNTCVRPGATFKVKLTWKRKKRKGNLFVKVRSADFYLRGKRVKIDVKAPFTQTLTVTAGSKSGSTIALRARAFIKVKRGKSPTKSIRTTIKVC